MDSIKCMDSIECIKGFVENIIFHNSENGYTVLNMVCGDEEIVCVGSLRAIDQGEMLELKGNYVEHPMYGRQFKVVSCQAIRPDDEESIRRYLSSGAIRGIGEALAGRIIKKFGADTFRIMEEEPERLAEIKGISERKAREIAEQLTDKKDLRDAMVFLQRYGISGNLAVKIYDTYGLEVYRILQENPYRLAEDIGGIGFKIADEIAQLAGIHMDSDYRIRSAVLYQLMLAAQEGHTYLPAEILLARCGELLGLEREIIEPQLSNMAMDKKLIMKRTAGQQEAVNWLVYAPSYYYAEMNCAKMLHDLAVELEDTSSEKEARIRIEMLEEAQEIELDELQREAVLQAFSHGIVILTGGPGTGKTTTINTMIRYFLAEGLDIFLAAPTGRAAKRMTEATGYEARTIHRLLELNGAAEEEGRHARFERNEDNPLEADVIIVDEMSMVDIHLFQALLKAVMPGTRLILAGDIYQLPSVGPGQVLRDLIESKAFPVVMLKKIFRQAEGSDIVVNSHHIKAGEHIALDNKSSDFFFLERNDVNVIYKHMILLIREKLPPYVKADMLDIQVLTPMRKGSLGVERLNVILQEYLNPPEEGKTEYAYGDGIFRLGDKVMQIKNNYQISWEIVSKYGITIDSGMGVFNGDIGIVKEIREITHEMVVEYDEKKQVVYPFSQLDEIELAYAVTIHKSQGSEYPAVVMPLLGGPRMLMNRNLLYTGITRAKSCVTILGSRQVVEDMIANGYQNKRYSSLKERICEMGMKEG